MKSDKISKYISGVAVKRLSAVEISKLVSNQHELNGVSQLKELLGLDRKTFVAEFIFLPDDENKIVKSKGSATWYDSREKSKDRTEYRLYYSESESINCASQGDLIAICLKVTGELLIIITPSNSNSEGQLRWLFSIAEIGPQLTIKNLIEESSEVNLASRYVLESIGIDSFEKDLSFLDLLFEKFGHEFPPTMDFSSFAREMCRDVPGIEDPDVAIVTFLEREEMLFRLMEEQILQEEISQYYKRQSGQVDVDGFISLSLSVINRRKVRAGLSFENHLAYIFNENKIMFSKGSITERNNKPDFIFPGISYYAREDFPSELLDMLGVKSSTKDRWRQILTEADRINKKHLITLQPAISQNQTDEMVANRVQLVVPNQILTSYNEAQRSCIMTLDDFIRMLRSKQMAIYTMS